MLLHDVLERERGGALGGEVAPTSDVAASKHAVQLLGEGQLDWERVRSHHRFVAQSMELSIGYLMAHANANAAECMGLDRMAAVARLCFWPIAMAQCCCWRGEITDNKWWHVVEESLWGCGFAVHTILSVLALVASHLDDYSVGGTRALARRFYAKVVPLGALYCGYMFAVDIPMYLEQWRCAPARTRTHALRGVAGN